MVKTNGMLPAPDPFLSGASLVPMIEKVSH
jgi:hypothetical protein